MFRRIVFVSVTLVACGGPSEPEPIEVARTGEAIFTEPNPAGNTFTCSTCHALTEPAADGVRRVGHALGDAFHRSTYKNGQLTSLRDAVNTCVTEWMLAPAYTETSEDWLTLSAWLEAQSAGVGEEVTIQIVEPPADVTGGDPEAGRATFNATCVACHGQDGGGTVRAPGITGLSLDVDYIARRVRTSGLPDSEVYEGLTGGRMPFWGLDRLSDDELRDIAAFVATADAPEPAPEEETPEQMGRSCAATHPSVGRTARLQTFFHGVRGTATIVDDCTIELTDFHYDGAGIDVQVYAARDGNYAAGFSISPDLVRRGGYAGDSVTLTLPEGRTLDEIDGISVWCVAVGVDFGSGSF
ncbi:MAG: DM13 domain-containing protein [Deltaproteobacteria bacterium]